jgi:uncharacterized protein with ATP-grasp and redox domains
LAENTLRSSVLMIERHYSHLKVIQAVEQLIGAETRRKIASTSTVEDMYQSSKEKKPAAGAMKKLRTNINKPSSNIK